MSIRCWLGFVYLIGGNVCSSLLTIFKWTCVCFCCSVVVLYRFWMLTPSQIQIWKCFLPWWRWPFHSVHCVLWCTEVFTFDVVQFLSFVLLLAVFHVISKKSLPNPVSKFSSLFSSKTFIVLGLWFIFCLWHKEGTKLHSFARGCHFPCMVC